MIFKELLESGLIKDDDSVCVNDSIYSLGSNRRAGNWYQDHILNYSEREIDEIHYNGLTRVWEITLRPLRLEGGDEDLEHELESEDIHAYR